VTNLPHRVRVFRGDIERFPADVYVVSSSGGLSGNGVAARVARAYGATDAVTQGPKIALGTARAIETTEKRIIFANTGPWHSAADPKVLVDAMTAAFTLAAENAPSDARVIAMPMLGTRKALTPVSVFVTALKTVLPLLPPGDEVCIAVPDEARQRELLAAFPPRPVQAQLQPFVDAFSVEPAFLFVGAGLSMNAVPRMPSWLELFPQQYAGVTQRTEATTDEGRALARELDDVRRASHASRLPDIAQVWADEAGDPAVVHRHMLAQIVARPARPSLLHFQLLALPWNTIITTNYDTLIESTLHALGRSFKVVRSDAELAETRGYPGLRVVKLHGGIKGDDLGPIIATRDEYDSFFDTRPGLAAFLESHLLTSHGMIVGHSMSDAHFRALFARVGRVHQAKSPAPGIVALSLDEPDSSTTKYWAQRGIMWHGVGSVDGLRDLVDSFAAAASVARRRLPERFPTAAQWASLFADLDGPAAPVHRARLLAAIVEAGGMRPPDELIQDQVDRDEMLALISHHFSPEDIERFRGPR
jgi:O-acetyl-ADP-ribose deacetylase (regulator of RNase III)